MCFHHFALRACYDQSLVFEVDGRVCGVKFEAPLTMRVRASVCVMDIAIYVECSSCICVLCVTFVVYVSCYNDCSPASALIDGSL